MTACANTVRVLSVSTSTVREYGYCPCPVRVGRDCRKSVHARAWTRAQLSLSSTCRDLSGSRSLFSPLCSAFSHLSSVFSLPPLLVSLSRGVSTRKLFLYNPVCELFSLVIVG